VWGALILTSLNATNPADLFLPIVLVAVGCIGCRELLRRDRYVEAVWSYIIALMVAVAIMSHTTDVNDPLQAGRLMILFVMPLGILLVGFLLPARSTVLALGLAIILTLIVPTLGQPFVVTRTQVLAIILMLIAVGIAAQMSGALYGIAEWALESYRKERETKEQLFDSQQEIQRSFMRQKALAEQLQETNVELEAEIEDVDLEPIFKGVLATAVGLVGDKPIKLKRDTTPHIPHVRGDSLRIRQVILNLLSNASKFTDEGAITLGARDDGNGQVTIWVKDSGIGIPPQEIDKIFEEFRQGTSGRKKGRAGSGLGLAISRKLLILMNGRIWVESTIGQGSSFYFALPVYVAEPVEQQR
jgi:signal transduction histidine kinase